MKILPTVIGAVVGALLDFVLRKLTNKKKEQNDDNRDT